jgi:hypothetical protein
MTGPERADERPPGQHRGPPRHWLAVEPAEEKGIHRLVPHDVEVSPPQYAALADPVPTVRFDGEGAFLGIDIPEELPGQQMLDALPMDPEKKAE